MKKLVQLSLVAIAFSAVTSCVAVVEIQRNLP
jgi:hypothetical protein